MPILPVPRVEGGAVQQEEDLAVGGAGRAVVNFRTLRERERERYSTLVPYEHRVNSVADVPCSLTS